MKCFRYRRPLWKTILGSQSPRCRSRKTGIAAMLKPFYWWTNQRRRIKRGAGYESDAWYVIRDRLPTPGGCRLVVASAVVLIGLGILVTGEV